MSDDIPDSQQISRDTAAELHNVAVRHGVRLAWIVMTGTVEYGDKFVARPWNENINRPFLNHLIANDLESIRGQLPPGLYKVPRQGWEIPVIVEKWYDYCSHEHSAGKEDGMNDPSLEERNALAAIYFPKSWADAQAPGKKNRTKRTQLRNAAEHKRVTDFLRAQGASCATCRSFGAKVRIGSEARSVCWADSDFHGYAITVPSGLCHLWRSRPEPKGPARSASRPSHD